MMHMRNDDTALMFHGNIDIHFFRLIDLVLSLKSNRNAQGLQTNNSNTRIKD